MARRPYFHWLEVLEQDSGLDTPIFDKQRDLKITSEQLKKDLDALESRIPGAKKVIYDTQILSLRNDLDHLMNKTKGIEKTHEKTADGGRGLGRRQDRMKLRTAKNEVSLAAIDAKVDALDEKILRDTGIESERQMSKHLGKTLDNTTNTIIKSGVLKVDSQGKVIGYDQAVLSKMDPVLQKNIESGRALWEGKVDTNTVVNSGAQGIIGGGMDKLWYSDKNIKNVVNIAKILAGLMIIKTYWEKADTWGKKIGYGIGLYALLSNDALGGWDMFWEGGKNGVLDINGIINKAKGQPGVNPEVIQNKEMILKGKDKVAGLKILFDDPQKLKKYLNNDQGKWTFDNKKFLNNYGLDTFQPGSGREPIPKEDYSSGDINDPAAACVLSGLIGANKYGQNAQLNDVIDTYLQATDLKTPDEVINASPNDLNTKANDALAKIDTEQAALIAKKQAEEIKEKSELNVWVLKVAGPGFVVVEGQEDAAIAIKDLDLKDFEKKALLDKQGIIRKTNKQDIAEVTSEDREIFEGLTNIGYTEQNANALVSALVDVRTALMGSPAQYPKLVFEEKSVFYQNHGKKIEIKSKSPDETMKFDLSSLGLTENLAQGTAGFTAGLLLADAFCNIFGYIGTMDQSKIVDKNKAVDPNNPTERSSNEYPFRWDELTNSVKMYSQSDLTSFANANTQINTVLRKAFEIGNGWVWNGQKDHTKIQNLLTNLNGAKVKDENGIQHNAWIEGQGFTIPSVLNAQGASIEQKSDLNVAKENIQTMGDLVMYVHDKTKEGVKILWSDVVDVLERVWGDTADMIKKAIPELSEISGLIYDEVTKGIKVVYVDVKGAVNTLYADGKKALKLIYEDGKSFTVESLWPDLVSLGKWTIDTAGTWTQATIEEMYQTIDVLMDPKNIEKIKKYIWGLETLVGTTLEAAGNILKNAIKWTMGGAADLILSKETLKLLAIYWGYLWLRFAGGVVSWLVS